MSTPPLLSASNLCKSFGTRPLFSDISLSIEDRDRIALIGPNGAGKSTLLKILAGLDEADSGQVRKRNGVTLCYVPQEEHFPADATVISVLERALEESGLTEHHHQGKIETLCGKASFPDRNALVANLSGGWKKRLAIVRGLVLEPDILLLDEPTNHLDIDGIFWLEELLQSLSLALVFVSHDRYFIQQSAQRVVDINRIYPQGYFAQKGSYDQFLEAREAHLAALNQQRAALANRTRREVEWLRQGAKARTTKSKYRSEQAHRMVAELKSFNLNETSSEIAFSASSRKSRDLIILDKIGKALGGKLLFNDISITITPGTRLGVVGTNGSGKTTLLKTILGQTAPDSGMVTLAKNLRIAFFDQARKQLDLSMRLRDALCPDGDTVYCQGKSWHIVGWADRFLFSADHLSLPLSSLSGGERARVLLARLMVEEADVLIFDEPTNDLDIGTLEILEDSFCDFPGAIVLVTHDRYLLERVATRVLGIGTPSGFFGGYLQWEAERSLLRESTPSLPQKLSREEQKELDTIEREIIKAEKLVEKLEVESANENLLKDPQILKEHCSQLASAQKKVEELYNRWEELEDKKKLLRK